MKNRYFEAYTLVGVVFIVSLFISGCKKGDESLGKNLIPGSSLVYSRNYSESGTIKAFTFTDDKIRVDRPAYNYIGSFNDPLFGRTDAGFAAQYRLTSNPNYDKTSILDSLVLRLTYKRIYGDTATVQALKVYELTGDLEYDAKYMSSFNLKAIASTTPLGSASFIPKFKTDSAKTDTTTQYVRFRLSSTLGNRLLKMDSLSMISNEVFLKYFKGLYVEASSAGRKGTLIGLSAAGSGIGIYYHTATKDSLFFSYNVTANSANIAAFSHDYRNSIFYSRLNQELIQDTLIFLQPTGGTKIKVNIPSLNKWKDSTQYVISKASITFFADTLMSDPRRYSMPSSVYLKYMDSTGTEVFPKDSQLSSSYYGGIYDPTTASYTFNITRHLEQIIKKEIDNTSLFLVPTDRNGSPYRLVLKGGNSSRPIQLNIKYTRYQ
ncbi:MAG: DUF4270 family protein [Prolixibacteraceae bacterium]